MFLAIYIWFFDLCLTLVRYLLASVGIRTQTVIILYGRMNILRGWRRIDTCDLCMTLVVFVYKNKEFVRSMYSIIINIIRIRCTSEIHDRLWKQQYFINGFVFNELVTDTHVLYIYRSCHNSHYAVKSMEKENRRGLSISRFTHSVLIIFHISLPRLTSSTIPHIIH